MNCFLNTGKIIVNRVIDMINNIIIEVYTSMAEQERVNIKQRQAERITVVKK